MAESIAVHVVDDDTVAHAVCGYLKAKHGAEVNLLAPTRGGKCQLPDDGLLLITNRGQIHLPDEKFPPKLYVVFVESWNPDQLSRTFEEIQSNTLSIEKTRERLPWQLKYHGFSFEEAHGVLATV